MARVARIAEVFDDTGDFVQSERTRRRGVDEALAGDECLCVGPNSGRAHGRLAVFLKACVRDTAGMPELNDDGSALGVHGVGDLFPAPDLLVGITARRIGIALRLRRDLRGFGDDQAGRGALGVIFGGERTRDQACAGAVPGQRRHDDAIGELEGAYLGGFEQCRGGTDRMSSFHLVFPLSIIAWRNCFHSFNGVPNRLTVAPVAFNLAFATIAALPWFRAPEVFLERKLHQQPSLRHRVHARPGSCRQRDRLYRGNKTWPGAYEHLWQSAVRLNLIWRGDLNSTVKGWTL